MCSCVAIIPARGGSKRIPNKNIKNFCGKPIIAYSIETAISSNLFDKVIVSTDSEEIATIAKAYGAEVPFLRPIELSDDFTTAVDVVDHTLEIFKKQGVHYDYCCTIYATAPLLQAVYLQRGLRELRESEAVYSFSCSAISFPIQRAFRIMDNNRCEMFWPENFYKRSQDLEVSYQDAGQFYFKKLNVLSSENIFSKDSLPIVIPNYLVHDIDTHDDWEYAELLYSILKEKEKI